MKNVIQAAIIDLDGVITRTAIQHAKSWKIMFDLFNERRMKEGKEIFKPLSIKDDYPRYIAGIPRYNGVSSFLASRNINIPYGNPNDEAGKDTVCGLGNWKNKIFLEIIQKEGVDVFEKNVAQIENWKKQGLKTAVISSSKNCKEILEATGVENLFDIRIDGVISEQRKIVGKPAPDIFLEAAKELNIKPEHALIVEDSLAGVEAGKNGNFGLVVGIINGATKEELLKNGADEVVEHLQMLDLKLKVPRFSYELPSALQHFEELKEQFIKREAFIFLDFDGTLAPIVEHYEDAAMTDDMKTLVKELATEFTIAIISGRGLNDIQNRVGVKGIYYSGSHGFEISGPHDFYKDNEAAKKIIPAFDELEPILREALNDIEGVRFERKRFTLAVHYRQVKEEKTEMVFDCVDRVLKNFNELTQGAGKKVIEFRPKIDWDKGKAVEMLMDELNNQGRKLLPVYIGDDITDEDVFRSLDGVGIIVGDHGAKTYADYNLQNVNEVEDFLNNLLALSKSLNAYNYS